MTQEFTEKELKSQLSGHSKEAERLLNDENKMEKKIADMKATISQLAEYENGMLDISYDIWEDKVGYTPFS